MATAGCGGGVAGGPGDANGAATVVPANAVAFLAASTDLRAQDWHGLGDPALQAFRRQTRLDWSDVRTLAGDELDVAVLPGGKAVGLVQPQDEAKLDAFARDHGAQTRRIGDWTAVARDAATLDAVAGAKTHLSDNTLYLEAMGALPGDALARAYANGAQAKSLLAAIPGQLESQLLPVGAKYRFSRTVPSQGLSAYGVGVQQFRWLAAALTSTGDGMKLEAVAAHGDLVADRPPRVAVKPIEPYVPTLPDEIPAGVLGVVDFKVADGAFELLPQLPKELRGLFGGDMATLATDLDTLLGGESALYVRPSLPMPEVTLVTQPADTTAASATLDSLLRTSPRLANLKLHRAVIGGQFVVSTTQKGIDDFKAGGAKLSDDAAFAAAKKQSGMPDRTTGFVYVNAKNVLSLLRVAGVPLPADLPDLRALTAFGAQTNDRSSFTAFLGVG